jgi:hypothetical protein
MRDLRNAMDDTRFVATDKMPSPISEMILYPIARISHLVSRISYPVSNFIFPAAATAACYLHITSSRRSTPQFDGHGTNL